MQTVFLPRCLRERIPGAPTASTQHRIFVPLPAPAGTLAGFVGHPEPWRMRRVPLCLPFCLPSPSLRFPISALPVATGLPHLTRCPFRKFGTSRTSCPRRRASSPRGACALDSRLRGNDARLQHWRGMYETDISPASLEPEDRPSVVSS